MEDKKRNVNYRFIVSILYKYRGKEVTNALKTLEVEYGRAIILVVSGVLGVVTSRIETGIRKLELITLWKY